MGLPTSPGLRHFNDSANAAPCFRIARQYLRDAEVLNTDAMIAEANSTALISLESSWTGIRPSMLAIQGLAHFAAIQLLSGGAEVAR